MLCAVRCVAVLFVGVLCAVLHCGEAAHEKTHKKRLILDNFFVTVVAT
jgi:hypothetical protein